MSTDHLTILTTAGRDRDKLATKQIRLIDGAWSIEEYGHAMWWSAWQVPVSGPVSLGKALATLEHDPHSCVIRGEPIEGINLARCLRRKDTDPDGTPPSFTPAARHWLGIDVDSLPTPVWDPDKLARRQAAIARDRAEHGPPLPKGEDDGEDVDLAGDEDPAPINAAKDWTLSIRAAVRTLPPEFHDACAYWQMTSGAGIKPGIRLRLWYWCDRPVSDDEAKRWLEDAPVDSSIYGAVAIHYTAAPVFDPPELDPVPLRSGFWWRHCLSVKVPDLTPKVEVAALVGRGGLRLGFDLDDRAQRYAKACLDSVIAAPAEIGKGRSRMIAVARTLYGMANKGLLDEGQVTAWLYDAMANRQWDEPQKKAEGERIIAWAKDHADTTLPEGFR